MARQPTGSREARLLPEAHLDQMEAREAFPAVEARRLDRAVEIGREGPKEEGFREARVRAGKDSKEAPEERRPDNGADPYPTAEARPKRGSKILMDRRSRVAKIGADKAGSGSKGSKGRLVKITTRIGTERPRKTKTGRRSSKGSRHPRSSSSGNSSNSLPMVSTSSTSSSSSGIKGSS